MMINEQCDDDHGFFCKLSHAKTNYNSNVFISLGIRVVRPVRRTGVELYDINECKNLGKTVRFQMSKQATYAASPVLDFGSIPAANQWFDVNSHPYYHIS